MYKKSPQLDTFLLQIDFYLALSRKDAEHVGRNYHRPNTFGNGV